MKSKQSANRADKRKSISKSDEERTKKVLHRYNRMKEYYSEKPLATLIEMRHDKMSQTDFHALKFVIDEKERALTDSEILV